MFGLFQKGPKRIGGFSFNVYQPSGAEVSVSYTGAKLSKADALWLRGLYAAKSIYTASSAETVAYMLAAIAKGCASLDEDQRAGIASAAGVNVVPTLRAATTRFRTHRVDVVQTPKMRLPVIQTHLPSDSTAGDLIATVAAFNETWLGDYSVDPGSFAASSFLQFFGGFLSYYHEDPAAATAPESIYQAPMKAYAFANASAVGLVGLADD